MLALCALRRSSPTLLATQSPYVGGDLRTERLLPPGEKFWLGTDDQARDIYSRIVHGSRLTLLVVVLVSVIAAPIGLAVGTIAGYAGGWVDVVLSRLTDIFLAFPRLVLALAFVAALGPGIENAIIAIAITIWPPYARIARAETLTIRHSEFIQAVRLQGGSSTRIILKHVVPLCLSSVIVRVTLDMAGIILTAAGLGFLGLGAQPPLPEWGAMIAAGRRFLIDHWWVAAMPGHRDLRRQPRLQPARRWATRRARPEGLAMSARAAPRRRGPACALPPPARHGRSGSRRLLLARSGKARDRGGIRFGEIADRPRDTRPDAAARRGHGEAARLRRDRSPCRLAARAPPPSRQPHDDGDAGPEILARSGDDRGQADRRGLPGARQRVEGRGAGEGARDARGGAHPQSAARPLALPARALRRHGPTRDDRHDARHRPRPSDRR